jgi:hypothetical protein
MADNTTLDGPGSGGDTIATDDIGGVKFQRVKLVEGADGTNDGDISSANPLPVELTDADGTAAADITSIKTAVETIDDAIDGTEMQVDIVADGAGLATDAKLDDIIGDTGDIPNVIGTDGSTGPTKTVSVAGTEADGTLQEIRVDADGHPQVDIQNASLTVDATGSGDVPITLDGEVAAVDATGQGDVPVTLDGEEVILGASDGTDIGDVDVASHPADTFVAEDGALGKGVLIQGDDGADRHNIAVDTSGNLQVDIAADSSSGVEVVQDTPGDLNVTEANSGAIKTAVEGTLTVDATGQGDVPVTLDGETVTETNTGAILADTQDIPNVIGTDGAAGPSKAISIAGTEGLGGNLYEVAVDASGQLQIDIAADSAGGVEVVQDTAADLNVTEASAADIKTAVEALDDIVVAEDAAHGSGDKGVMPLAVRNDDLAALAGADGDYAPPQVDAQGALYVNPCMSEMKNASGVAAGGAPGTDNMVAAVADRKICVHAIALFATSTTVTNVFVDNDDNDLLFNSGNPLPLSLDADADTVPGFVLPFNPGGWFTTDTVNQALTLNTSAAQDVAYAVTYTEVL